MEETQKVKYTIINREYDEYPITIVKSDEVFDAIDLTYWEESVYRYDGKDLEECTGIVLFDETDRFYLRFDELDEDEAEEYKDRKITVHDRCDGEVEVVEITKDVRQADDVCFGYQRYSEGNIYIETYEWNQVVGEWEETEHYTENEADYPKHEQTIVHVFANGRKIRQYVSFYDTEYHVYEFMDE